jgi:hypothetical protein
MLSSRSTSFRYRGVQAPSLTYSAFSQGKTVVNLSKAGIRILREGLREEFQQP